MQKRPEKRAFLYILRAFSEPYPVESESRPPQLGFKAIIYSIEGRYVPLQRSKTPLRILRAYVMPSKAEYIKNRL